jgi:hypothetical protein
MRDSSGASKEFIAGTRRWTPPVPAMNSHDNDLHFIDAWGRAVPAVVVIASLSLAAN